MLEKVEWRDEDLGFELDKSGRNSRLKRETESEWLLGLMSMNFWDYYIWERIIDIWREEINKWWKKEKWVNEDEKKKMTWCK